MLFWLTLIQLLPNTSVPDLTIETTPKFAASDKPSLTAQTMEPIPAQSAVVQLSDPLVFLGLVGGVIVLLLIPIGACARIYRIAPNNEAFVRTGGIFAKKQSVILRGGCFVLPGFYQLTRVPLREIAIAVKCIGNSAIRTQDYLRINLLATFYVCVNANPEDVLVAATRLSKQGKISKAEIYEAVEKRADDAIRSIAKHKGLHEIDVGKDSFAREVLQLVEPDLKKVGLTLNQVAISELEEANTYDQDNFFDAQGSLLRTEIIERSLKQQLATQMKFLQEKREIELSTEVAMQQKELEASKQQEAAILARQKEDELQKLADQKELEALKAQVEREIQTAQELERAEVERQKILQDAAIEQEKIQLSLASKQSQIEADVALEESNKQRAEVARQVAELEAESMRIRSEAQHQEAIVQAKSRKALIEVENTLSSANRTAELIRFVWPDVAPQLTELAKSLAPQPGVLGNAPIHLVSGSDRDNGASSASELSQLLLSTGGASLISALLVQGKLGTAIEQVNQWLKNDGTSDVTTSQGEPAQSTPRQHLQE